jgi:FlaA1/EpsC-like NDP-sugar epimerase
VSVRGAESISSRLSLDQREEPDRKLSFRFPSRSTLRRLLAIVGQLLLIPTSTSFAFQLRFDGSIPAEYQTTLLKTLPMLLVVRGLAFVAFGIDGGLWRYAGIWDLCRIILAVSTSTLVLYGFVYSPLTPAAYPRSVVIIDALLLIFLLGGVRLIWRMLPYFTRASGMRRGRRVLIIGAGDAGDMIVREMRKGGIYRPVGFVDDDPSKIGRTIHGIKVLGTRTDIPRIVAATKPAEVLVAIPSAPPSLGREFVRQLEGFKIPITTVPSLAELVNGTVGLKEIRPMAIEDLLPRNQIALDTLNVRQLISRKRVLVTGAGGSIGSELCRQIAAFGPTDLVLFERYENGLYTIVNDLTDRPIAPNVHAVVGDVTDAARVQEVFEQYRPQIIFHAAAHKHVPLMEANPSEAVKNNVVGTQTVADAAHKYGSERFVLISTDKAVNPTSVMGATKRVAEFVVQTVAAEPGDTRFVTVRFGNVLGSNGSVVPRMIEQIRAGGPVTVTHPEIRRYFMLIPEAVQLVLQAAVLARGPETFVLEMGEQVRILDVARNLIRLSGFVPDEEIPISFIGLRPGEKLHEELTTSDEALEPAGVDKILRVRRNETIDADSFADNLATLIEKAAMGQHADVIRQLRRIVPTFNCRPVGRRYHTAETIGAVRQLGGVATTSSRISVS